MPPVNFGQEALVRLQRSLGVEAPWTVDGTAHWSCWGTLQRAGAAPSPASCSERPTWRVHLSTLLLDGFTGSVAQVSALSSCLPHASLAAVLPGQRWPGSLELTSTVDVHHGNVGSMVRLLAVAARAQVVEARFLASRAKTLTAAGLGAAADPGADIPASMLDPNQLVGRETSERISSRSWFQRGMAECVDTLLQQSDIRAVQTPWGVSATFLSSTSHARSILEISVEGERPLLGSGISVSLWTPLPGGPQDALLWNRREVVSTDFCHAFGGWWVFEPGFLVHRSFYPVGVCHQELVSQFLAAYSRRANQANAIAAEQG